MDYLTKRRLLTDQIAVKKKCFSKSNDLSMFQYDSVSLMPPLYFNNCKAKPAAVKTKKRGGSIIPTPIINHQPIIYNEDPKYMGIYENIFNDSNIPKEDKAKEYKLIQEIVNLSSIRKNLVEELQKEITLIEIQKKCKQLSDNDMPYDQIQNMMLFGVKELDELAK